MANKFYQNFGNSLSERISWFYWKVNINNSYIIIFSEYTDDNIKKNSDSKSLLLLNF
jgi:hypothetical protein